jgi:hypothetical protein
MTLSGQPPQYTRGYSFTQHSIDQPNTPQPGDKLDAEFNDISTAISASAGALDGITNADGTLKDGIVGEAQLQPGLFDEIVEDAQGQLQPIADAAAASAAGAQTYASAAQTSKNEAATSATTASGAATSAQTSVTTAQSAATGATAAKTAAEAAQTAAANSATTADGARDEALLMRDEAEKWAEYLAGPVEPAPPGWPEAIDDGMWSAKWWAIQAKTLVGEWGTMYLGASAGPPPPVPPSNTWPPGSLYFDTVRGEMLVWDGSIWKPITQPGTAVQASFLYIATAGQQDFFGPDFYGQTPTVNALQPQPSDVHLNGAKLVQDKGSLGDYTVDPATSTLHINVALTVNSVVQWDLLQSPQTLAPGSVTMYKLHDIDRDPVTNTPGEFDGTTTTFPLRYTSLIDGTTQPATPGAGVQLQVQLDGCGQEVGPDFTTSGSSIVFGEAPQPGARFWGVWMQPGAAA